MAEQTEKAFLKQPKVFLSWKKLGKGKRPGKSGNPFWKNIGLRFKTLRDAIEDSIFIDNKVVVVTRDISYKPVKRRRRGRPLRQRRPDRARGNDDSSKGGPERGDGDSFKRGPGKGNGETVEHPAKQVNQLRGDSGFNKSAVVHNLKVRNLSERVYLQIRNVWVTNEYIQMSRDQMCNKTITGHCCSSSFCNKGGKMEEMKPARRRRQQEGGDEAGNENDATKATTRRRQRPEIET
ncbi:hypothetical protein Bca101_081324 [Brassica carinata]